MDARRLRRAGWRAPEPQQRLLRHILCLRVVSQHASRYRHRRQVPVDERAEGLRLAGGDARQQRAFVFGLARPRPYDRSGANLLRKHQVFSSPQIPLRSGVKHTAKNEALLAS
jgi:hypothetical protein